MPKFVIEREIAGAGKLPRPELQAISKKSCSVLQSMGPKIQWLQSYVTDNKIYCLYIAPDEDTVRTHAQKRWISSEQHRSGTVGNRSHDSRIAVKQGEPEGTNKCPLWVKSRHRGTSDQCPLYPQKRTLCPLIRSPRRRAREWSTAR